jgi:heme o synthase
MQASIAPRVVRIRSLRLSIGAYRKLTLATAFCVWALIVLGGAVRVTDSGTGCGETWPMCQGHLFPAFEYHQLVEWNHRLFATLVGLLMATTVGSTLLWYRRPRKLLVLALLAGTTYIAQAVLGGITVLLHLDHTWVAAHMGNSMILLGSVVLLAMFAREDGNAKTPRRQGRAKDIMVHADNSQLLSRLSSIVDRPSSLRWLALITLVWTYLAMLTGSAVVGADADVACPAWPQCSDAHLLPLSGVEWINFGHRIAVGFSDVLMLALTALIWRVSRDDKRLMRTAHVLAALYITQVFLGAFTIWLGAPDWIRGAHLALAAATWAALVVLTASTWATPAGQMGDGGSAGKKRKSGSFLGVKRAARAVLPETARMYIGLMRPHVIPLLLVPAAASMLIAAVQHPPQRSLLELLAFTMLGGTLAAGGAHAINQYLDRDIDARMKRTSHRPVVTGRIAPRKALLFGLSLSGVAAVQMWLTVNPPAAILAVAGNLFYVFVYTIWLKRSSVQNIVIGGAAGAVPPLVGWAAVTGNVGVPALLFFAIIFFWTPAHFWALALVRQEEYREAGIPMLPVVKGEAATRAGILRYAVLLAGATVLPFAMQALGWVYLAVAVALGFVFVRRALQLLHSSSPALAWRLFKFSNAYLALLYAAMVVDRLLALGGAHPL